MDQPVIDWLELIQNQNPDKFLVVGTIMTKLIQILAITLSIFCSNALYATYVRSIDVDNYSLAVLNCYGQVSDNCIVNVCLTSDERDCQEVCRQLAANKCQIQRDDWILNWPN